MADASCPRCGCQGRVGIERRGVYDGILYWQCAGCGHRWHRWSEGTWQRAAAVRHVDWRVEE